MNNVTLKNAKGESFKIDCAACKLDGGMEAARIARFSMFIRFIGYIIAIPSALGMAFAVLIFFTGGLATPHNSVQLPSTSIVSAMGMGIGIFIFCTSLVSGLVGWLLLMKKNVYRCVRCGYIIDRSS